MKKKELLITAGTLTAGCLLIAFFARDSLEQRFPTLSSLLGGQSKQQQMELTGAQAQTLAAADAAIAEAEKLTAETVEAETTTAKKTPVPWTLGLKEGEEAPRALNPKVKVFSPLTLDPHPEHLPGEGEQVVLPMLGGKSVKVNVESTSTNDNGDYIWSGHLAGHDNSYPVVMTYGQNTTFATITTPEGSYSLEAVKGKGWLYKNPAEAELTSQGKDDFLIPEIH